VPQQRSLAKRTAASRKRAGSAPVPGSATSCSTPHQFSVPVWACGRRAGHAPCAALAECTDGAAAARAACDRPAGPAAAQVRQRHRARERRTRPGAGPGRLAARTRAGTGQRRSGARGRRSARAGVGARLLGRQAGLEEPGQVGTRARVGAGLRRAQLLHAWHAAPEALRALRAARVPSDASRLARQPQPGRPRGCWLVQNWRPAPAGRLAPSGREDTQTLVLSMSRPWSRLVQGSICPHRSLWPNLNRNLGLRPHQGAATQTACLGPAQRPPRHQARRPAPEPATAPDRPQH